MRTHRDWYRQCLLLSRLHAWEQLLEVYLPYHEVFGSRLKFFTRGSGRWTTVLTKDYWQWYAASGGDVHKRILNSEAFNLEVMRWRQKQ